MAKYKTPGVYINEVNSFPNSVVQVETAIPAFIGYTFKAELEGKSLLNKPTRITSFAAYLEIFGGAPQPKFKLQATAEINIVHSFKLGNQELTVSYESDSELYFYNSIRMFYANGGNVCYILSVGIYGDEGVKEVRIPDFIPHESNPIGPLEILEQAYEPTLIVIPDIVKLGADAYPIYVAVLAHCGKMQNRFGIFDLRKHDNTETPRAIRDEFRTAIGTNFLNYGAAYYPWLNTVNGNELSFGNLPADLESLLEPEQAVVFANYATELLRLQNEVEEFSADQTKMEQLLIKIADLKKNHHLTLKEKSPFYNTILNETTQLYNELPPNGAIAGIYTMVDSNRGVWKSPSNCSVINVMSPTVRINNEEQEEFNIDSTGVSINIIRSFAGKGVLVWGGRTLDGNSNEWKYISVRRTMLMIEKSIKLATERFVFESNTSNTWIVVKAMIDNFLTNLWKMGALAGATPDQAFYVKVGLGSTMTPTDILDGIMNINVFVALVRPSEFIIITFQQQMQQS